MKAVSALILIGSAAAFEPALDDVVNHPDFVERLNSVEDTWVAGTNAFFEGKTFADAKALLGTVVQEGDYFLTSDSLTRPQAYYDTLGDIPSDFDSREAWKNSINPIRDQQRCGSCWAFSAVEVLSDRFGIATNGSSAVLSAEDIVSCDSRDNGCGGGQLPSAWNYLQETGVVSDSCMPYSSGDGNTGTCSKKCTGSGDSTKFKASSAYAVKGVENMQKEIMTHGPIQVAFMVYKSFMTYKSGVYKKKFWEFFPEGGHAVKIVGWGTEDGTDYWLVANSWNTSWGLEGYFKIARGSDQCKIESVGPPYAGTPAV